MELHNRPINPHTSKRLILDRPLEAFERTERLLSGAEVRRNNALREIDRHCSAYGAAICRTLDEVAHVGTSLVDCQKRQTATATPA